MNITPLPSRIPSPLTERRLARAADRWYYGSGATQNASSGARDLGTVFEGSVDVRIRSRWTLGGDVGSIVGGEVVTRTFAGNNLVFGFVESTVQF